MKHDPFLESNVTYNITVTSTEEMDKSYPVLLSMHGSGIEASNHADAHKYMTSTRSDYIFGVQGFILIAPSRFGAHNWEGIGELSARHAVSSLRAILEYSPKGLGLPRVRMEDGMVSGHSMGGHGAWLAALNAPNHFHCLAPLAGLRCILPGLLYFLSF